MQKPTLSLYDTLTGKPKPVLPSEGHTLRFYGCGPTVYGPAHIGNFRTFVTQDLFRRVVELHGTPTLHVRNITDVDDKTIRQSQAEGKSLKAFTQYWTEKFHADCQALNCLSPHHEPGAVDHIPEQIELIRKLMERGHAYCGADGSVYFNIKSLPQYGCLSKLDKREITTAERDCRSDDEYDKESLADFALWKARKPEDGDNYWDSPWGAGRPGWHLECSAMSMKYLGDTFDVHSGGIDLCFPHHENEIAQSEGATGKTFAHHWFHITHLMVENKKMSKSLGNLYTLDDLCDRGYTPVEVRYVLISGHYRQPLNFTFKGLDTARKTIQRITSLDAGLEDAGASTIPEYSDLIGLPDAGPFEEARQALLENLLVPKALGLAFTAMGKLEKELNKKTLDASQAQLARTGLHFFLSCLGLSLPTRKPVEIPDQVIALAEQRVHARKEKNWQQSDALRDALKEKGWSIQDHADGYSLTPLENG